VVVSNSSRVVDTVTAEVSVSNVEVVVDLVMVLVIDLSIDLVVVFVTGIVRTLD
jgi:hypothetical protein